jgi:hypothetical protein
MLKCKTLRNFYVPSIRISTGRRLAHTHRNRRQHERTAVVFYNRGKTAIFNVQIHFVPILYATNIN